MQIFKFRLGFGSRFSGSAPSLRLHEVGLDVGPELELGRTVGGSELDEWDEDRERVRW